MNQKIEDKIVLRVLSRFSERSQAGINKYNTTLERTDLSTLEWLTHAQEEAMDFVLYLERLKDEYRGSLLTKMVKQSEQDGLYEENVKQTMPK
jgi:GTPase SAR1 family protein